MINSKKSSKTIPKSKFLIRLKRLSTFSNSLKIRTCLRVSTKIVWLRDSWTQEEFLRMQSER